MADQEEAYHSVSTTSQLQELLKCKRDVGHNVLYGTECVANLHESAMRRMKPESLDKFFNPSYRQCGVSAAHGTDGKLYISMYFRS